MRRSRFWFPRARCGRVGVSFRTMGFFWVYWQHWTWWPRFPAPGEAEMPLPDVSRTVTKIKYFCFYISTVTETKELENLNACSSTCIAHRYLQELFQHPVRMSARNLHHRKYAKRARFIHRAFGVDTAVYTLNKPKHCQNTVMSFFSLFSSVTNHT